MQISSSTDNKKPEIERCKQLRAHFGLTIVQFAHEIGVPKRTIDKHISVGKFSDEVLRAIYTRYGVSLDWLVNGIEPMYVNQRTHTLPAIDSSAVVLNQPAIAAPTANDFDDLEPAEHKPLFPFREYMDLNTAQDFIYLWAAIFEQALEESGAVPGKDYGRLDLVTLAQPFVRDRHRLKPLELTIYERHPHDFDDD